MQRRHDATNIPTEILRSFATIQDTGSYTKAGAVLNLTQSAISAQMKRLENLAGGVLFNKGPASVTLTDKGRFVNKYARRILACNDQIIFAARGIKSRLRVGLPTMYSGDLLKKIVSTCREKDVDDTHFFCDSSNALLAKFETGHLDVVVAFSSTPPDTRLTSWVEPMVWVCGVDFLLSPGSPIPLLSWPGTVSDEISERACEDAGVPFEVVFVATDINSHIEALRSGMGYRALSERSVPEDLKIARDHFLPKLHGRHAAVRVRSDVDEQRAADLVKCIKDCILSELRTSAHRAGSDPQPSRRADNNN